MQPVGQSRGRKKTVASADVTERIINEVIAVIDDFESDPEKKLVRRFDEDGEVTIDIAKPSCTISLEIGSINQVVRLITSLGEWTFSDTNLGTLFAVFGLPQCARRYYGVGQST